MSNIICYLIGFLFYQVLFFHNHIKIEKYKVITIGHILSALFSGLLWPLLILFILDLNSNRFLNIKVIEIDNEKTGEDK